MGSECVVSHGLGSACRVLIRHGALVLHGDGLYQALVPVAVWLGLGQMVWVWGWVWFVLCLALLVLPAIMLPTALNTPLWLPPATLRNFPAGDYVLLVWVPSIYPGWAVPCCWPVG